MITVWLKLHLNFQSATENIFNLKYSVKVIEHMYKQNKNILMTQLSNVPSLDVYSLLPQNQTSQEIAYGQLM